MTPYEVAKMIHRDLSPIAPKLAAAINRALVEIGEGSMLVGLGPGTHENDDISFQEQEEIRLVGTDGADHLIRITAALSKLEEHSSWKVIVDKKTSPDRSRLQLLYTLYRIKDRR
jgi:hypothetical protein